MAKTPYRYNDTSAKSQPGRVRPSRNDSSPDRVGKVKLLWSGCKPPSVVACTFYIRKQQLYFAVVLCYKIIVQSIEFIDLIEVRVLKALKVEVIHCNQKGEQIDIHSDESKDKIKKGVFDTINQKIQK